MKYRPRIYYSDAQKALMWDRWQKGDSMHAIARLFDRGHGSIQRILSYLLNSLFDSRRERHFYQNTVSIFT